MGILDMFSPGETDKRAEEVRKGAVAPLRTERAKCYIARDAYFGCLDANNIVDALKDEKAANKACGAESKDFERDCATAWVGFPLVGRVEGRMGCLG
jgi:cytochrome c oxidase assembly factor 6